MENSTIAGPVLNISQWHTEDPQAALDRRNGFRRLHSGQQYIYGFPAGRKSIVCDESNRQSLIEAADWVGTAFDIARFHAMELEGNPLLLKDRTLTCTSSFTGLLVFAKDG